MGTAAFWVKINNWDKHNPRKDIKKPSWFAFDNRMVEDEDFLYFNHGEFKTWIYLLSKASQKVSSVIKITPDHAEKVCNISKSDLMSGVKRLSEMGIISLNVSDADRERAGFLIIPTEQVQTPPQRQNVHVQNTNADVRNANATDRQTGQDKQDRTGEDTGEQNSPSAVRFKNFQDLLKAPNNQAIGHLLKNVPENIQEAWIDEFHNSDWIIKTIRKCITKRESKKLKQEPQEWAGILSAWLYTEKNPPPKPKETQEWQNPDAGKPDTKKGIEYVESLLDTESLKKFRKFTSKQGGQYAN